MTEVIFNYLIDYSFQVNVFMWEFQMECIHEDEKKYEGENARI